MNASALTTDCLVFDVGGTHLRAGLYRAASSTVERLLSTATPNVWTIPEATQETVRLRLLEEMWRLSVGVLRGRSPAYVCVAFAGPVDTRGRVLAAPTIWGSTLGPPLDLLDCLQRRWPAARIVVMNDVAAAGYRYRRHANEDFCIVTVSSGIGNKVFLNGHPILGDGGRGGEIGHVRVDFSPDALLCDCGAVGHLGAVASGRGTLALARCLARRDPEAFANSSLGQRFLGHVEDLENPDLVEAFHAGDPWTLGLIRDTARPLGQMLAGIHLSLGIDRFILIGGFALALGEPYRREVASAASGCEWDTGEDWQVMLELGVPDDQAGLIGAGRFALESSRSHDL
jgi:predicted NBD/HSP70 family sugar kinase